MIRTTLEITRLYLHMLLSERSMFIFTLALPLLFTFVLGLVTDQGDAAAALPRLQVVNEDHEALAQGFIKHLQTHAQLEISAATGVATLAEMEAGKVAAVLVIPGDFSQVLAQGKTPTLALRTGSGQLEQLPLLEQALQSGAAQFMGALRAAQFVDGVTGAATQQLTDVEQTLPVPVTLTQFTPTPSAVKPGGLNQSSPGMLVMFALFFILGGSTVLIEEREAGTLRRLLTAPIAKASLLAGKGLGIFVAGILQMSVLIGAGTLLFGVNWGHAPLALVLMVASFALATTCLSILVAALARTTTQAGALCTILVYGMSALGGAWWPLTITPRWMQQLAQLFPTYWGMAGFQDIILRNLGTTAVAVEVGVLCGFAALFLTVGVWRFRYE